MTFRDRVYEICKRIPEGKVATYGQIAAMAGVAKAARTVGRLMKINPFAPVVPCHRVVAKDGSLTGYFGKGGMEEKKRLLLAEGVVFKGGRVDMEVSWAKNF